MPLALLLLLPLLLADDCSAEQDVNDAVKEQTKGQLDLTSPVAGIGAGVVGNKDAADAIVATRGFFRADHSQLGDQAMQRGDFQTAADEYAKALQYTSFLDTGDRADIRNRLLANEADALGSAALATSQDSSPDAQKKAARQFRDAGGYWESSVDGQPDTSGRGTAYYAAATNFYYAGSIQRACSTISTGLKADIDQASRGRLQALLATIRGSGGRC